MFPADMTPCSGQGAGDACSTQRQGIPRWSCYAQGTSSCTTLPWAWHRGLAPGSEGLPVCISRKFRSLAGRQRGPFWFLILLNRVTWRIPEIRIPLVKSFTPAAAYSLCMPTEVILKSCVEVLLWPERTGWGGVCWWQ